MLLLIVPVNWVTCIAFRYTRPLVAGNSVISTTGGAVEACSRLSIDPVERENL